MDDQDTELRDIKREIVESRGLIIKTNNLTNALASDLKSVSKRQLGFERRMFWNSGIANALFVAVVLGSVKVAWDARARFIASDLTQAQETLKRRDREIEDTKKWREARESAESRAAAFYELLRAERRQDALDQYDEIRKLPLTRAEAAFFTDAVERSRAELSIKSYQTGLDHLRMGRWHEAAVAFEDAIQKQQVAAHAPSARLNLARAYRKLGRQRDAIPALVQLSEASADREVMDDATLLLAECLIDVQAWNDAKTALRSFIRRFPDSPLLNDARMALANIAVKH
jgi:TolA-binding protein